MPQPCPRRGYAQSRLDSHGRATLETLRRHATRIFPPPARPRTAFLVHKANTPRDASTRKLLDINRRRWENQRHGELKFLSVALWHTYYVSQHGVLVHNGCSFAQKSIKNTGQLNESARIEVKDPYDSGYHTISRDKVAGDHVLPQKAISTAIKAARSHLRQYGVKLSADQLLKIKALENGTQNLRPMDTRLNSSKGDRNMWQWAKTKLGGGKDGVSASYRMGIHKTQVSVASKINAILNEGKPGAPKDFFAGFFSAR